MLFYESKMLQKSLTTTSSNSYVWVMQSAACEDIRATFFHYSKSRARSVAEELLKVVAETCTGMI